MPFTAGYKVNANTQFEFTVSDETLQEVVQGGGITESDIADYCYTALIDSRVAKIVSQLHTTSMDTGWTGYVRSNYYGYMSNDGAPPLNTVQPSFNTDLLSSTDTAYQRNFLVWDGTIYPNTEQAKTGTFLVMDVVNLHNFYLNYDNAGFTTTTVTSGVAMDPLPEGYTWPGYSGAAYEYISNTYAHAEMRTNNNDPHLNPNCNMYVINVLVFNDQLSIGELNPSSHGSSQIGFEDIGYGAFRDEWLNRYGGYLNPGDPQRSYQGVTGVWGAVGNYSNATALPGCPNPATGNMGYTSYVELANDDMLWSVSGSWGQQNYACSMWIQNDSITKSLNVIKKWMSWCGLMFQYDNVMYKPIIEGGIVVGYTDDMSVESEYDDMTNVTGNNIPSGPPKPPPEPDTDDPWHGVNYGSGGYGSSPFCTSYAMTGAELAALATWGGKTEEQGGPKAGYDYMPSIISLVELPMEVSGTAPSTVKFSRGTLGGYDSNIVDTGVSGNPITAGTQRYNLGSVTLPLRMSERGYPFLDWDTVVELYMPFVGMFSLDPFAVLGKTITAFMDLDVLNGTICGYAYVTNGGENLPVAYGSAQVGVSLPVTSEGAASARLALTTANAALGSSIVSSALQLGTLAAAGGTSAVRGSNAWTAMQSSRGAGMAAQAGRSIFAGGAADAVNGYASSSAMGSVVNSFTNWGLTLNRLQSSNNTQVNGSLGGGSFSGWSTPNQAYVKIIRPHAAPGAKATEYSKTHAYPYEANATLKECKGLTFAVNPNVSGITKATDAERSQIAEILMGGVIA